MMAVDDEEARLMDWPSHSRNGMEVYVHSCKTRIMVVQVLFSKTEVTYHDYELLLIIGCRPRGQ